MKTEPLTVTQVNKILREIIAGVPLSIPGDEAKKMRATLEKEVAELTAAGKGIDLPSEYS